MCVCFQGAASYVVLQHDCSRRFFVEAAALVCVTVYGLQENLVDDGSAISIRSLGLVVVDVVCLRDCLMLHYVKVF